VGRPPEDCRARTIFVGGKALETTDKYDWDPAVLAADQIRRGRRLVGNRDHRCF
jgi:hypothetical protein